MDIQVAPAPTQRAITEGGGVDPETGKISFSQTLVEIPVGSSGLVLDVTLHYDNLITEDVITWNAQSPTGPVGLGWALGQRTIFRDPRGTGTTLDDRLYLLDGEIFELVPTAQSGNTWTYQAKNDSGTLSWQILYVSNEERWTVVKPETGHTLTFGGGLTSGSGGMDSAGHSIEWAVRYGGWMGSTSTAPGQQFAVAWNVHTVEAGDGSRLTYVYNQVQASTGSSSKFTQASYVSTITASTGPAVEFVYDEKEAPEIPPYRGPAEQFRYQALFLLQLRVTEGAVARSTVDLAYEMLSPMYKRLLTGIAISADAVSGAPAREVSLRYYGTDPLDDVTVTFNDPNGLFNDGTEALYGSLKSLTTVENGVTLEDWLYKYDKVTIQSSQRMFDVLVDGEKPRVVYGSDYLVLAYENTQRRMVMIEVWEWDNTWQRRFQSPIDSSVDDIDDVEIAASESFFVAAAPDKQRVLAVRRSGSSWRTYPSGMDRTDQFQLAAGDEFYAIMDTKYGLLSRWRWTGSGFTKDTISYPGGSGTDEDWGVGMTANRGFLFTTEIKEASNVQAKCRLFYLDPLRRWNEAPSHIIGQPLSGIEVVKITPGEAFVLVDLNTDPLVSDNHTYALVTWDANYGSMRSQIISTGSNTQIAVAGSAVNHAVQSSKNMYRYDGSYWVSQRLDNLFFDGDDRAEFLYPDLTLAVDNAVGVQQKFKYYNYTAQGNRWLPQDLIEVPNEFNSTLLRVIALAAKVAVKLALLGVPRALKYLIKYTLLKPVKTAMKAIVRMFTSSGVYQYQDTGSAYLAVGTTSGADQLKVYLQSRYVTPGETRWVPVTDGTFNEPLVYDIMSEVDSFFVWMTQDESRHNWVTLVRNGQIVTLPDGGKRLSLDEGGQVTSSDTFSTVPDEDQPLLYTPECVVAYLSPNNGGFRDARFLRLSRVIQDGVSGPVSDFVARSVTNVATAAQRTFDYDEAAAVFDAAAGTARFPR
jgi:hypothetical protein